MYYFSIGVSLILEVSELFELDFSNEQPVFPNFLAMSNGSLDYKVCYLPIDNLLI
jgi:hypothetical protein